MQEKCHRASFYWLSGVWAGGISAQRSHRGAQLCQLGTPNLRKKKSREVSCCFMTGTNATGEMLAGGTH